MEVFNVRYFFKYQALKTNYYNSEWFLKVLLG